jgi:translation initiation factor eIF-2B subunit beta
MDPILSKFEDLLRSLKRGEDSGTYELCKTTCMFLLSFIKQFKLVSVPDVSSLIISISTFGKLLCTHLPLEISVVNIVRRVLHIIREEAQNRNIEISNVDNRITTLTELFSNDEIKDNSSDLLEFHQEIRTEVENLIQELITHDQNISKQAINHIYHNEIILTYGFSKTVLVFLLEAKDSGRKFEVLVGESAPLLTGHQMCKELTEKNIETTLITDSAVFALMSRVNKVVIGTRALMANGGLLTEAGHYSVCLAAQAHCVPVLVTCGLYKISPLYPFDQYTFNEFLSPWTIADRPRFHEVEYINYSVPAFDYIPPELVSLYITDVGGKMCSYLYRLLSEYYSLEDYNLFN